MGVKLNGRVLDRVLVAAVAIVFLVFAMAQPGLANLITGWVGVMALGYYNSYVRHRRGLDPAGLSADQPVDPHDTLRAAWR
jgi:hypothetical protein